MNADLRRRVRRRAKGRCEYCRTPFRYDTIPEEVDHIIALQHGGQTIAANLALACLHCNSHKGPNIASLDPRDGALTRLFNPRGERWTHHFRLFGPIIVGLTPQGRATVRVLDLNDPLKVEARAAMMEEGVF
jgi:hypothetical protein